MNESGKQYLRLNIVKTTEMTRGDYCKLRGWKVPENENPEDDGMLVEYSDGYVSWCPAERFKEVSIPVEDGCVPYGYAMIQCQFHGKRIQRKGWNGDSQFVRYEEVLAFENGVLAKNIEDAAGAVESEAFVFHFKNRHTGETGIQVGWLASQADMKAKDWVVLND